MTKLSNIDPATPAAEPDDEFYGIRSDGNSPETFQEHSVRLRQMLAADSGTRYDFGASFEETPEAGAIFGRVPIMEDIVIAADFAGCFAKVATNPAAEFVVDVQDDGASVFTVTIATDGSAVFATGNSPAADVEIAAESVVTFVAPSDSPAEATIAGLAIGIKVRVA